MEEKKDESMKSPYVKTPEEIQAIRQANAEQAVTGVVKHQNDTAGKAAEEVLELFGKKKNLILLEADESRKKEYEETYADMLANILVIFAQNKVSITDYDFVFMKLRSVINDLSTNIKNHSQALNHEILSRTVGTRDPVAGKFNIDFATHADLIDAVTKIRQSQGAGLEKADDYFTKIGE